MMETRRAARHNRSVALSNNKGVSLIEMIIAMVIILIGLLGMLQSTLLGIDNNLRNLYRDEAVRIAEETMNELKSRPVSDTNLPPGTTCQPNLVQRQFRNITESYRVCTTITNLLPAPDDSKKSVQVVVGWNHKRESPPIQPTNMEFQHSMTSIVGNLS